MGRSVLVGLMVLAALALRPWGYPSRAADPASPPGARPDLPPLPVVEKAEAQQPPVGLPTDAHLDKTPPRATRGLDLVKLGWSYNCMECHRMLKAQWQRPDPPVEHRDVRLDHGRNRFCLTCHHPTNRNAFVDYDGSEIAEADVVQLCAKCHGPTYRDWEAGVHGRRNGYWNTSRGPRTQLRCIQCHDPHRPRFQPMTPLPPPTYPARAAFAPEHAQDGEAFNESEVLP